MADPQREIEQRAEAVLEGCVALYLAASVTDDTAKRRAQEFEFPPGALELVRPTMMAVRLAPADSPGAV